MEDDCKDLSSPKMENSDAVNVTKIFAALLSQITSQNNNIQEQMWQNELKLC
jgi:hypothetical protein